jgi:CopG family nickel-responsive transcriptional regulator
MRLARLECESMTEKNTRASFFLPSDLLKEFDSVSKKEGYTNRSQAISAALREFITKYAWLDEAKGSKTGAILLTYDHDARGINDAITEIQHSHGETISATMHLHLDDELCLEIIAVRGDVKKIKELTRELSGKKGVLSVNLVTAYSK